MYCVHLCDCCIKMHQDMRFLEAVAQACSAKKVFLKISQNSQENTCARVSILIKLQAQVFSWKFCESEWCRLLYRLYWCNTYFNRSCLKNLFFSLFWLIQHKAFFVIHHWIWFNARINFMLLIFIFGNELTDLVEVEVYYFLKFTSNCYFISVEFCQYTHLKVIKKQLLILWTILQIRIK